MCKLGCETAQKHLIWYTVFLTNDIKSGPAGLAWHDLAHVLDCCSDLEQAAARSSPMRVLKSLSWNSPIAIDYLHPQQTGKTVKSTHLSCSGCQHVSRCVKLPKSSIAVFLVKSKLALEGAEEISVGKDCMRSQRTLLSRTSALEATIASTKK